MISERSRNIIVGLTIIVALGVLMYGIVLLGKFPSIGALRPYEVTLYCSDANGVTGGSHVNLKGVYAGQVTGVSLATNPAGQISAKIVLQIEHNIQIPASAKAELTRPQAVGNPSVEIQANAADFSGPMLATNGTAVLAAEAADSSLIPQKVFTDVYELKDQLSTLATQLTLVSKDLHTLLVYAPPEAVDAANPNDPNRIKENVSTVVVRLNRLAKSLEELLTDPALQKQVRDAIQNIADAAAQLKPALEEIKNTVGSARGAVTAVGNAATAISGTATQASTTIQVTQKEIERVSQTLVETLNQFEKTVRQVSEGGGTTGRLINDPRLYDGLLDLSKSLKNSVDDLDFLLKKWKDEGVDLHLGK